MDKFWLEKAKGYIETHNAFSSVSDLEYSQDQKTAEMSAHANVNLPSLYLDQGVTNMGVRNSEPVRFIFSENFPLEAPQIRLRKDFPRAFPHINPNAEEVSPCIYEGSLSELLQQAEWMNGILNQLIDWLEKAASNSLLNHDQGWEPMRNDDTIGFITYDINLVIQKLGKTNYTTRIINYEYRNHILVADELCNITKTEKAQGLFCVSPNHKVVSTYIPNPVANLAQLYDYANTIGIVDLKQMVENVDQVNLDQHILFVILAIPRPCHLIGSSLTWELLNFVIHKSKSRKGKKRVLPDSKVGMLSHIASRSPELLKNLSGSKQSLNSDTNIALVGCGSLGSKIGMHLVRNGNGPFLCIDKDLFMPHNNARHSLFSTCPSLKTELLSLAFFHVSGKFPTTGSNAITADYSTARLIIDSTASLAVRSFFMDCSNRPPVISAGLYNNGKQGILLMENAKRTTQLSDLWANLYLMTIHNKDIYNLLFSSNQDQVSIGQSCSSNTLVTSDSQISLFASSFSLRIQQVLEKGLPALGEILQMKLMPLGTLLAEKFVIPDSLAIKSLSPKNWQVRLSSSVENRMRTANLSKKPNETGGVLLGSVFLNAKVIVVTDILPPPPDSIETPTEFILGTDGLEACIKDIERKTNGKVTYLGTWHSHPHGGGASSTDKTTASRLLFIRNYEPTVCLIWTEKCVFDV